MSIGTGEDVMAIRSRTAGEDPIILRPKCVRGMKVYVGDLPGWERFFPPRRISAKDLPDWHQGPCTHAPAS